MTLVPLFDQTSLTGPCCGGCRDVWSAVRGNLNRRDRGRSWGVARMDVDFKPAAERTGFGPGPTRISRSTPNEHRACGR